ncbi:MAG: RNA-binding protein [Candidatus Melainabacteria bacterium RIFOXYA12_FULL_32_12]|nr:MAG: RNA-binding protein [Candidatus Melainabacteria bacterium GWF2_32_7]OGI17404.1 MAG: RNA-binding protein [Candidatus Melainabacteria bacterium RIFOXYA2_FULL_32_9]OGI26817.1 MAG: RNA-binding protein [Candidatus Melainabacteria bacterium RIFOXYA12_FULL_32_12]
MRIDKFLKVSRLIKRRSVANEVSDQGRVFINDKPAKPSSQVKEGDKITIEYYNKSVKVEVLKVPAGNVSIQESKDLYKIIEEIQNTSE